jgi:hypothetical protein
MPRPSCSPASPSRSPLPHADLTPEIYDVHFEPNATVDAGDVVEGCAGAATGRTLLRFGTRVENVGPDDLVLGNPGCPDCVANPGAACTNPLFVCSPGLQVSHYRAAAAFELLDPAGNVVVVGSKRGYCFNDDDCTGGATAKFTSCDDQGLTSGCIDDYEPFLSCQYLDVTDVPNVLQRAFRLRVTVDQYGYLPDADRSDNVTEVAIPGCGDGVLQQGEECDPGPGVTGACCNETCHLRGAGTVCRPASGSCDAAEVCDGASASCPADAKLADGTACGAGTPPCVTDECQAGRCVVVEQPGTCAIAGACFAAGAADPGDACRLCDPGRQTDGWSSDVIADPEGIRCQLDRVGAAVAGLSCPRAVMRGLDRPLRQLRRVVTHAAASSRPPSASTLTRLTHRLAGRLGRAARHGACDVGGAPAAVGVLLGQVEALAPDDLRRADRQ